jgi:hypothetical protein
VAQPRSSVAEAAAQMDARWTARAWPDLMEDSIAVGQEALRADPQSYDVTWRLARAYWWSGHTSVDQRVTRRNCRQGAEYAETAATLRPDRVEGYYYLAIATGEYAATIGISTALWKGVGPKIEQAALNAYAVDKHFDNGGPMITLGRFYSMLPWPLQDLDKSRRYLEEARDSHPHALVGRFYLAETYYKRRELALAQQELEFVIRAGPAAGTALVSPSAYEQATQRMAQWFYGVTPGAIGVARPNGGGDGNGPAD